jgi:hypothetical protein
VFDAPKIGWLGDDHWQKITGWETQVYEPHYRALHHGAKAWDRMLLWGLDPALRPSWVPSGSPRKTFMAGGSDAHGDLSYRRWGAILGTMHATDTAMGKPRNLVYVGSQRPVTVSTGNKTAQTIGQGQAVDALKSGNFSVTDGPVVRIAMDINSNGVLDDGDVPMGGDFEYYGNIPLLVQWKSTAEFGLIKQIDIYVGVHADGSGGQVYAPAGHGVRAADDPSGTSIKPHPDAATGKVHQVLADGYVLDSTGKLQIKTTKVTSLNGTAQVNLSPAAFPAFVSSCKTKWVCPPPPPGEEYSPCYQQETCSASDEKFPQRFYVRAVVRSQSSEPLRNGLTATPTRLGYSNPIWIKPNAFQPPTY